MLPKISKSMSNNYNDLAEEYADKGTSYYQQSRPEMLQFIPADTKRVLDVGCSSGGFGKLLKAERAGIEVWGIEPDQTAAAIASEGLDRVINGLFSPALAEIQNEAFECIVFNDVLEHTANPSEILEQCKQFLSPGGSIVASIPNILHFYEITNILVTQDWKYRNDGILDNTHLRFFTKKSIIRLFEEAGFKIDKISGIYPSFGMKYRIANLLTLGRLADWKYVQFGLRSSINQSL